MFKDMRTKILEGIINGYQKNQVIRKMDDNKFKCDMCGKSDKEGDAP